jgi:hypothetical protein
MYAKLLQGVCHQAETQRLLNEQLRISEERRCEVVSKRVAEHARTRMHACAPPRSGLCIGSTNSAHDLALHLALALCYTPRRACARTYSVHRTAPASASNHYPIHAAALRRHNLAFVRVRSAFPRAWPKTCELPLATSQSAAWVHAHPRQCRAARREKRSSRPRESGRR